MQVATITEAKNSLSALIDRVRGGDSVLIVDRGIPVAELVSAVGRDVDDHGRLARLERVGAVRAGRGSGVAFPLDDPPPAPRRGASAVAALLDERRSSR